MPKLDPKLVLEAAVAVERDLSILTGEELVARYGQGDPAVVFKHVVGLTAEEVAPTHNPFWHYILHTWYKRKTYRSLLYPPRHRDEVAQAVVLMATGGLDSYDGVHHQYPRRALKSFFAKMACDWLPKRHKLVDDIDIAILYAHNLERRAQGAMESVKNMNRRNMYIRTHFGDGCRTPSGRPANFVIPESEWGNKWEWDWPCRDPDFMSDQKNITAEAALTRKAGAGYNYKFLDDWEDEESRKSDAIRENLADRYDQVRQLNAPPFAREWSCGTPYHVQSFYKPMLQERTAEGRRRYWVIFCPALTEDNQPNFPTIPRLSVEALAKERANEIRRRGTDRFWYLQYQLDPTLTGEQAMQWDFFQPITPEEFAKRFAPMPKFRCVYCDPSWKGDDNHQEGSDAAIGTIDTYSIAGQLDNVLLDLAVSNDWESDEGADEILRQMRVWSTNFWQCEQQADKPMVGLVKRVWRTTPIESRAIHPPRFIDVRAWSKKAKNDRISAVAGQAKLGHWYYLTSIGKTEEGRRALSVLERTVNEYPASVKRDTLDMMANAHADEIIARWVPVAIPVREPRPEREPLQYVSRYTGLPAVMVH